MNRIEPTISGSEIENSSDPINLSTDIYSSPESTLGEVGQQSFGLLNILLTLSIILFIVPMILVPYNMISVSEEVKPTIYLVSIFFGLLYYVFLGILASKKNRSVIKWVGLSIIFSPLGHLVSYPLMLCSGTVNK